jgi:hypothetical protein
VNRCGICNAPTMAPGPICRNHWQRLTDLIHRCDGLEGDLAAAVAGQIRTGETTRTSTTPRIPINPEAVEARDRLHDALHAALVAVCGPLPRLTITDTLRMLHVHEARLHASWCAPVLCVDLDRAVPAAVEVLQPRRRIIVRVPCPRCQGGPLRPVAGTLECRSCRERMTVGEVRHAC